MAMACVVECRREQLFASARFAGEQHTRVTRRQLVDDGDDAAERITSTDDRPARGHAEHMRGIVRLPFRPDAGARLPPSR